jgi:hypothetical protein
VLNKFFLISLGGSGEKLARYLKQDLEQRLYNSGWNEGIPRAFRWLCLDVARNTDVVVRDVPEDLGNRNGLRIGLADDELRYGHYLHQVSANKPGLPALAGALPSPRVELPSPVKGAGQRPQIGNVVGLSTLQKMKAAVERQMVALHGDGVVDELERLSHHLRNGADVETPGTTVFIASSLGGGSGAGLLQLVVEMVLNTVGNDPQVEVATVLFTPDIFYDLTETERQGVQANCLYTLSTLINGYHAAGYRSTALAGLLSAGGIELSGRRRAATTNFFLGRGNGEFDFMHQNVAIKAAAKAMGRLLLDEEMVQSLEAHLKTNGEGAAVTHDYRIVPPSARDLSRIASSFGYASLSLGEAQLAEYASERLAKIQLETLLRGHKRQSSSGESDDATVERLAGEGLAEFLERAGLREQDVLAGSYDHERLLEEIHSVTKKVEDSIEQTEISHADPEQGLNHVERSFLAHEEKLEKKRTGLHAKKRKEWCEGVQASLRAATVESIGKHGFPVAVALLEAASNHVRELVSELRIRRDEELEPKAKQLHERARKSLAPRKDGRATRLEEGMRESARYRGLATFHSEESAYVKAAADLLEAVPEKVLAPLCATVRQAWSQFQAQEEKRFGELVESWSDGKVPPRIGPAPNQVLLEPVAGFPKLFRLLLEETMGEKGAEAEAAAAAELLTGEWPPVSEDANPISQDRFWRPDSATPAQFGFLLEVPDLKERSDRWIRNRQGALSDRLKLSIAEWLEQDSGREQEFAERFEQALRRADPLADISSPVHLRVHGTPRRAPKLHVSTIPVAADSEAYLAISKSLEGRVAAGNLPSLFDGTSGARMIEISSFFAQQVEPVVLPGLFEPIGDDWKTRVDESMREQFSAFRRTRSLPHFVPLSPADQLRFVCGWTVADLLGQLSKFEGSWDRAPLTVQTPEGRRAFPAHLLGGDFTDHEEVLARVMESLPLALVRCAAEQYEELEAYMRILDLGDLEELRRWVEEDEWEELDQRGGDRRKELLKKVERMIEAAEAYRNTHPLTRENVTEVSPRREIADLTLEGLRRVRAALDGPGGDPAAEPVLLAT